MTIGQRDKSARRWLVRNAAARGLAVIVLAAAALGLSGCGPSPSEQITRAEKALAHGQLRDAETRLKSVLRDHEHNAHAWLLLGRVSLGQGQYADAAHQFHQAGKNGTKRPRYALDLARALVGAKKYDQAVSTLGNFEPSDKKERLAKARLTGRALLAGHHLDKADTTFEKALKIQSDDAIALVGRARIALDRSQTARGRQLLARAVDAHPDSALALSQLGHLDYKQNKCSAAKPRLEKALKQATGQLESGSVFRARFMLAHCRLRTGQTEQAKRDIAGLLKTAPDSPRANFLQALVDVRDKKYDNATSHLQKVLRADPDSEVANSLLASVKLAQNDTGSAHLYLQNVLSRAPNNVRALGLQAGIYLRDKKPERAVALVRRAYEDKADSRQLRALLAQTLAVSGVSTATFNKQYPDLANDAGLQLDLARALGDRDRIDAARRVQQAVSPTDPSLRLRKHVIDVRLDLADGQKSNALALAKKLVKNNADSARAWTTLAQAEASNGDAETAYQSIQHASRLAPNDHKLALNTARLALRLRHVDAAHDRLQSLLKAQPDNIAAMRLMARVFAAKGQAHPRRRWLERAHRTRPDSIAVSRALVSARIADGATEKAAQLAQTMLAGQPHQASLQRLAGRAALAAGHTKQGFGHLEKAVSLAASDSKDSYNLTLAQAELQHGRIDKAIARLKALLQSHPGSRVVSRLLVAAHVRNDNLRQALSVANQLYKGHSHPAARAHALVGDALFAQQDYARAANAYAKAYAAQADRVLAMRQFNALKRAGSDEPIKPLQTWLKQQPHDSATRLRLAEWAANHGQPNRARTAYRRVLADKPDNPVALNNLALLLVDSNAKQALVLARRAHKAAPKNHAILDTLGWVLVQRGQIEAGTRYLKRAVDQQSPSAEMRYHYAYALSKADSDSARQRAARIVNDLLQGAHSDSLGARLDQLQQQLSSVARKPSADRKQTIISPAYTPRLVLRANHCNFVPGGVSRYVALKNTDAGSAAGSGGGAGSPQRPATLVCGVGPSTV